MSRWIKVTFHDTSDTHKLRNCTEELSLTIGEFGVLPFDEAGEIGFVRDYVRIVNVRARQLRRVIAFVEELLAQHFYDGSTTITSGSMRELDG